MSFHRDIDTLSMFSFALRPAQTAPSLPSSSFFPTLEAPVFIFWNTSLHDPGSVGILMLLISNFF